MGLISALKGVLQRKFDQESDIIGMVKAPERNSENSNNVNIYLWLTQHAFFHICPYRSIY